MKGNSLTTSEFWEEKYLKSGKVYPNRLLCRMDYEFINIVKPYLKQKSGGQLVELGCGDSYWLPYFAKEYGYKVSGMDFSLERLMRTKTKLEYQEIKNYELIQDDVTKIHEAWINKFDVVYSRGVIEHFSSPLNVLKIFTGYMNPDGLIITEVPHLKSKWGDLQNIINCEVAKGYVCMNLEDIIEFHKKSGLKIIIATYYRWFDPSVCNYDSLPRLVRRMIVLGIVGCDVIVNTLLRGYNFNGLPEALYSDMVIVAKR